MEVDFSDILEKSKALRSKQEAISSGYADNIPRLERALPQIDRESRRLASGYSGDDVTRDGDRTYDESKALRLLSEYGFQADNIERNLQSVHLTDAFEPYKAAPDTDLDAYLAQVNETTILSAVESALDDMTNTSMAAVTARIEAEWEASKRDLVALSAMQYRTPSSRRRSRAASTAPGGAFASPFRFPRGSPARRLSYSAERDSTLGLSARRPSPTSSVYEAVVRKAVHARATPSVNISVATELDDVLVAHFAPRGDVMNAPKNVQHMHAVFTALRYIVGEANTANPPMEGAYAGMYAAEDKRRACRGAYQFLCLQFREDKMKREIESRPIEARRGGVPGLKADVKAYLNLVFDRGIPEQLANGTIHDGFPIWPQIYYCLRAGSVQTALEVAKDALATGCTDPSVSLIAQCLEAAAQSGEQRTLPHSLLGRLVQDYGLSAKRSEDPYQRVCYVVLARLDPAAGDKMSLLDSDYSLLFYSVEDYLWLRLSVARLEGDEKAPNSLAMYELSLRSIQEEMKGFGPSHFDPQGDTPGLYALVLILTGQFSEALTYLDHAARAIVEAAHVAYTLYYYGVLREKEALQTGNSKHWDDSCFQFDYSELLWRYVSRFARTDPAAAAVYLFTLRDSNVRHELLRKLLLETKEFGMLLGKRSGRITTSSERQVGVLEELWPLGGRDAMIRGGWLSVVEAAAAAAAESGDRSSALALYDVAGVRGEVVTIFVDKLSAELTSKDSAARERVFKEANEYREKLEGDRVSSRMGHMQGDVILQKVLPSFYLLLSIGEFFDLSWRKEYEKAWELLQSLSFLPSGDAQLVSKTSELRVGGGVWADAVCDRVPEIVLGAMEVIAALHSAQRTPSQGGRGGGVYSSSALRGAARTLVNFSGMLADISADISARLVRLEVLMR